MKWDGSGPGGGLAGGRTGPSPTGAPPRTQNGAAEPKLRGAVVWRLP